MKRTNFILGTASVIAGTLLTRARAWSRVMRLKNWAGNLTYGTDNVFYPGAADKVSQLVKSKQKIKVLGTRHCFNTIADSSDNLLSTLDLARVVTIDTVARTVTVEAGIKYGELAPVLDKKGFALHNLASLPHISVGGSISTATHGSGVKNGNLATAVSGLEIVLADGSLLKLSRAHEPEIFQGVVVGLGAIGVITHVTLDIQPTFMISQRVFLKLSMSRLVKDFDNIVSAAYSVSLFTDWQHDSINEVWIKSRIGTDKTQDGPEFYGASAATRDLHPIYEHPAENCTPQMGVQGPWYERLPHFKMGFTPSSGQELQTEYFIPHAHAVEAIQAVARLGKLIGPHLLITEIRTIAADEFWMSPCYRQNSVTIHFTWKPDWPGVKSVLPAIEKALAPFNARPHWAKMFTMAPDVLGSRYEKLQDFKKLVAGYDPQGKFRNKFLSHNLYQEG